MKILVVNAGSSSLKYQLIEMDNESVLAKGVCERTGQQGSVLVHRGKGEEVRIQGAMPTHSEAIKMVLDALVDKNYGVISDMKEIAAVGHRVLHGGVIFKESALVTDETLKQIESNIDLGPLHMPPNIMGIKLAVPQCRTRRRLPYSTRLSMLLCPIMRICTLFLTTTIRILR